MIWFFNLIARLKNRLEGDFGGPSIIFLFTFRKFVVGDEGGVGLELVVALRSVGPALFQASFYVSVVNFSGENFAELERDCFWIKHGCFCIGKRAKEERGRSWRQS